MGFPEYKGFIYSYTLLLSIKGWLHTYLSFLVVPWAVREM